MIHRLAFIGPQGSGKGTQAIRLAKRLGVPQITPGAMYRREIQLGTERGKQIASVVDAGGMVPDAVTNALVADRVTQPDAAKGYIFDGYPRTLEQVRAIDELPKSPTRVVFLDIADELAVDRLTHRLVCICGKPFSGRELTIAEGEGKRCVACNGHLERRKDDQPDAVRRRLAIYHERTEPVIAEYRKRGMLVEVDGSGSIDEVYQAICAKLEVKG